MGGRVLKKFDGWTKTKRRGQSKKVIVRFCSRHYTITVKLKISFFGLGGQDGKGLRLNNLSRFQFLRLS